MGFLPCCGVQGPPRPPRVEKPERVQDLSIAQQGQTFLLSFPLPVRATDGESLTKPLEVEIFRKVTPSGQTPAEISASAAPWAVLSPDALPRYTRDQKIDYPDRLTDQQYAEAQAAIFSYAVVSLTRGFRRRAVRSELSNVAQATLLDVSPPVENLKVRATEKAVELSWSPLQRSLSGRPLSGFSDYRVYRSGNGAQGPFDPRGETSEISYLDSDFEFGQDYFYKVRAIFKEAGHAAESDDSSVAAINPRDIFPPAVPSNLSAIYADRAVNLVWTANTEFDLAGYNVYRRESGGEWRRLNKDLLPTPTFRDTTVVAGRDVFYRVTAVDRANNESPPSQEAAETR